MRVVQNFRCFGVKSGFVAIYALLCGEKIIKKLPLWRKIDRYKVWAWVLTSVVRKSGVVGGEI